VARDFLVDLRQLFLRILRAARNILFRAGFFSKFYLSLKVIFLYNKRAAEKDTRNLSL